MAFRKRTTNLPAETKLSVLDFSNFGTAMISPGLPGDLPHSCAVLAGAVASRCWTSAMPRSSASSMLARRWSN